MVVDAYNIDDGHSFSFSSIRQAVVIIPSAASGDDDHSGDGNGKAGVLVPVIRARSHGG